jgi:hypothetical protein
MSTQVTLTVEFVPARESSAGKPKAPACQAWLQQQQPQPRPQVYQNHPLQSQYKQDKYYAQAARCQLDAQ